MSDLQYFATGLISFSVIYSTFKYLKHKRLQFKEQKEYNKYDNYQVYSLYELGNKFGRADKTQTPIIFAEGNVQGGNFKSTYGKNSQQLIYLIKTKNNIFSTDSFLDPDRVGFNDEYVVQIEKQPFFNLSHMDVKLKVILNDKANVDTAIQSLGFQDTKRSLSLAEYVSHIGTLFYASLIKILGPASLIQILGQDPTFRGVHIGYREYEFGIKGDGLLQVLGSLKFDLKSNQWTIDNPILLTLSKRKLLNSIKQKIEQQKYYSQFWGFLALLGGLYIIFLRKQKNILKEKRMRLKSGELPIDNKPQQPINIDQDIIQNIPPQQERQEQEPQSEGLKQFSKYDVKNFQKPQSQPNIKSQTSIKEEQPIRLPSEVRQPEIRQPEVRQPEIRQPEIRYPQRNEMLQLPQKIQQKVKKGIKFNFSTGYLIGFLTMWIVPNELFNKMALKYYDTVEED
ncbi:hypothetical protein pb186bvf_000443 [Paramecium bursaria]